MNLFRVEDGEGYTEDEFSLSGKLFGEDSQIEILGLCDKRDSKGTKLYLVKCNICSNDLELYQGGYFRARRGTLEKQIIPCGCSKNPKWNKDQIFIKCQRVAIEIGYTFIGFVDPNKCGTEDKIVMLCDQHGEWKTTTASNLVKGGYGCPSCKADMARVFNTKPDDVMIASFFASGAFHPDTKFWRSMDKTRDKYMRYWSWSCPDCGDITESISYNLQIGRRRCSCSARRRLQFQCYVNWVVDNSYNALAIKFGIATNYRRRVNQQNIKTCYTVINYGFWIFPLSENAKNAEKECKQELRCGILSKDEMLDGWSETTDIANLLKIYEIYSKHGGVYQEIASTTR